MNFNPSEFSVCRNCGQKLPPYAMFCDNCGGNDILRPDQSSGQTAGNDMNAPDGQYAQGYQYAQNYSGQNQPVYYPDDRPQKKRGSALPIILASLLLLGVVGAGVWLFRDELGLTSETNDSSVGGTAVTTQADDADGGYSDSYGDNDGYSFSSAEQTEPSHELPNEAYDSSYLSFDTSGKIFDKCKASSYADWQGTRGLTCWAFDSKDTSCWQDGNPDAYAEGEWLMAYNSDSSAVTVSQVTIRNGYYKPGGSPLYDENSRVSNFELEFDDGSREAFRLEDHDQEQTFTFTPRDTCYVKLIITGVYRGTKYNDTCISEITYR